MNYKKSFSLLALVLMIVTSSGATMAQTRGTSRAAKGGGIVGRIIIGVLGNPKIAIAPTGPRCVKPRSQQRTPRRVSN